MNKLNKRQAKLLVISILIIAILVIVFLVYSSNNSKNISNVETENLDELKANNQENIIKAQSYKAPSLRAIDDSDIYLGNLDADLEIVVYEDYSNTFSAQYKESLDKLVADYSDEVVLAFRPFSVSNNGLSSEANQALYCANDQDKYLDFREEVFTMLNNSNLYEQDLYTIAKDLGLDTEQFSNCLDTNEYLAKVNSVSKEANDFGVFGAPTTFVDSELVIGAREWEGSIDSNGEQIEGLKTIIEKHLSK
ncbi:MAG TPA: thioredoxin domain-containing protein [Patescibacteria group bacterium]|nr:thioredoxin domain-containing protein [Patescibacteria group bacterium]